MSREFLSFGFPKLTDKIYGIDDLTRKKIQYRMRKDSGYLYLIVGILLMFVFLSFIGRVILQGFKAYYSPNNLFEFISHFILLAASLLCFIYLFFLAIKPKKKLLRIFSYVIYGLIGLAFFLIFFEDAKNGSLDNTSPKLCQALPLLFLLCLVQFDIRGASWLAAIITSVLLILLTFVFKMKFNLVRFHIYAIVAVGFIATYLSIQGLLYKYETVALLLRRKQKEDLEEEQKFDN